MVLVQRAIRAGRDGAKQSVNIVERSTPHPQEADPPYVVHLE